MNRSDLLYKTFTSLGFPFSYECIGLSHIRVRDPAIFVSNHLASMGPVQMVLSLPIRLYPWVMAEMLDFQRAPQYLYDDFIRPGLHLQGRFGFFVSRIISRLAVRLLNDIGSIPIDRSQGVFMEPYRRSLDLLCQGKNLLIFPEDSKLPLEPVSNMRPFMRGFVFLSPMYYRQTGLPLPFYPVAVSSHTNKIAIAKPLYYDLRHGHDREAIAQFCDLLQNKIKTMYSYLQKTKAIRIDDIPFLFGQEMPDEEELAEVKVGNR